jgi:hypothetical protein
LNEKSRDLSVHMTHPNDIILMHSGTLVHLRAPRVEGILLEDIAHHLSHISRFTGAGDEIATVAQHCVHVSLLCPPELAAWGLLHDASEAYLNDCSSPLKALLPDYRRLEDMWQATISVRFSVLIQRGVKPYDIQSLLTELYHNGPRGMTDHEFLGVPEETPIPAIDTKQHWFAFNPRQAKSAYLQRAAELGIV